MAIIQLDLFGWADARETQEIPKRTSNTAITADILANALIKHFGAWVPNKMNLLGDDWTVCETLIGINKVFTRDDLGAVDEETWQAAWNQFESFYLTKRIRSTLHLPWPMHKQE